MTKEEMIQLCPDLLKINEGNLMSAIHKVGFTEFDMNKTWDENGLNELDCIEVIMTLESDLGIQFTDVVAEQFTIGDQKPLTFMEWNRDRKLNQLGI